MSSIPAPQCDKTDSCAARGLLHKKGDSRTGATGPKLAAHQPVGCLDGKSIRWYDVKGGKELGNINMTVLDRVELMQTSITIEP